MSITKVPEGVGVKPTSEMLLRRDVKDTVSGIGLGELSTNEFTGRFLKMSKALKDGLERKNPLTLDEFGRPTDRGLLAIQTRIPAMTKAAWEAVPENDQSPIVLVGEIGGTNLNLEEATKVDGKIVRKKVYHKFVPQGDRQVTTDQFTTIMANTITDYLQETNNTIDGFAWKLGSPHDGEPTDYGMEATFITKNGQISNQWNLYDWLQATPEQRRLMQSTLQKVGIDGIVGIGINDTPGVMLDTAAALEAEKKGFEVLRAGVVAGTGSNGAIDLNDGRGIINTEIGQGEWIDDEVAQRMRRRLNERLEMQGLQPVPNVPKFEHELGEYLPLRLAAGIDLLGEKGFIDRKRAEDIASLIEARANQPEYQSLISDLAMGNPDPDKKLTDDPQMNMLIQGLALSTLERAQQVYGIFFATLAEPVLNLKQTTKPAAILTEGSTIHKGFDLKAGAQRFAGMLLRQPLAIVEASGVDGIATLGMSWKNLALAA